MRETTVHSILRLGGALTALIALALGLHTATLSIGLRDYTSQLSGSLKKLAHTRPKAGGLDASYSMDIIVKWTLVGYVSVFALGLTLFVAAPFLTKLFVHPNDVQNLG